MESETLSLEEIAGLLAAYKSQGADAVDFGGGEPTIRKDLPAMAAAAKSLGYSRIGLKTNGMRLCYPEYTQNLMDSGINEFSVSVWGHNPETHDALAGREGVFEMTEMGIKHLVDFGADVCVDFLLTTTSAGRLTDALRHWTGIGAVKFRLWLYSIFGSGGRSAELLPPLREAGAAAADAFNAVQDRIQWMKTSHLMPCVLKGCEEMYFNIRELDLLIVSKNNQFKGETSPFEAGVRAPACRRCRYIGTCAGPRAEYIQLHGTEELRPIR